MKNIACHISKQRMLQPSRHHITGAPAVSPEGTQDRKIMPTIKSSDTAAPPPHPMVHPEEIQDEKTQDTGPR